MDIKIFIFPLITIIASYYEVLSETITCEYKEGINKDEDIPINWYSCNPTTMQTTPIVDSVTEINGEHLAMRNDSNVLGVSGAKMTFRTLSKIFCEKFRNLERLAFIESEVEEIDENAIESCLELKRLMLSENKIRYLPEKLFSNNQKLKIIDFRQNQLKTLPENLFLNLNKLESLYLSNNQIASLPLNIFKPLVNLDTLALYMNKLIAIHAEWFENLHKLDDITLINNQITDIPKNAFVNMLQLSRIDVALNNLTIIHGDSFGINPKLLSIFAEYNQINAIDENFINKTSISTLYLKGNVCSQSSADYRTEIKDAFKVCFENYKPRGQ